MAKDTKLVHISIVDASVEDIEMLRKAISQIKGDLPFEFLITNDTIQLHDVKFLIGELYKLYKMQEKRKKK